MDVGNGGLVVFVKEIAASSLSGVGGEEYWKLELEGRILDFEKDKI